MAVNKIQKFIKDNNINLYNTSSNLNGNCVVLAGYACYLNIDNYDTLQQKIEANGVITLSNAAKEELYRVFNYAYHHDYDEWWACAEAHTMYKF